MIETFYEVKQKNKRDREKILNEQLSKANQQLRDRDKLLDSLEKKINTAIDAIDKIQGRKTQTSHANEKPVKAESGKTVRSEEIRKRNMKKIEDFYAGKLKPVAIRTEIR